MNAAGAVQNDIPSMNTSERKQGRGVQIHMCDDHTIVVLLRVLLVRVVLVQIVQPSMIDLLLCGHDGHVVA